MQGHFTFYSKLNIKSLNFFFSFTPVKKLVFYHLNFFTLNNLNKFYETKQLTLCEHPLLAIDQLFRAFRGLKEERGRLNLYQLIRSRDLVKGAFFE